MMALDGIRVVDFSRYAPGPYCTMLLADLGADVIVIEEPPGRGRRVDTEMAVSDRVKAFLPMGRNKRSVVLDLKDERMREAFFRLVDGADVVTEGFRPVVEFEHPEHGTIRQIGIAPKFSETPGSVRKPAPRPRGAHGRGAAGDRVLAG